MSDLPPGFIVQAPQKFSTLPAGFVVDNAPPPGVIIHDTNRSYVTGAPDAPSVDTEGMDQGQRNLAAAALNLRQNGTMAPQALQPAIQGMTSNFGDELTSAMFGAGQALKGGSFGQGYNLSQEAQRQALAQERTEHPYRSAGLQFGGALAQAPFLAPLAGAGGGLSLAARMAAGAGAGGVYGAASGFGSGSGLEDRLKQTALGGATGAVIGGAVPAIAEGGRVGVNKILDQFTVNPELRQLGVDRPAANSVMRALSADDAFSGIGAQNIAVAGPEGMLVDAGPSARGALDTAMQRGGPATRVAQQAVSARGTQANRTLTAALDRTLGQPEGVEAATTSIRKGSAVARGTAYDAAYAAPIDYTSTEGQTLLTTLRRVPGKVVNKANELLQLDDPHAQQIFANVGDDGRVAFQTLPDVRQLDYITRGLRQLAESGEDAGKLGGRTDFSNAAMSLSHDIRGDLKDIVPEYGKALATAADPISKIQAMRLGQDMLQPGTKRDEVALAVARMSDPELQAVRQGIRAHIDDLMANVQTAASDPNQDAREAFAALKKLGSRAAQTKLQTVLAPDQAEFLTRELNRVSKAAELQAGVTRNSATYGRTAVDEGNKQMLEPGVVGSATRGKGLQVLQRGIQYMFGTRPQDDLARSDEHYRQIAELLTGKQGQDALDAMGTLTKAYQAAPGNADLAKLFGGNLGAGAGLLSFQAARPLLGSR